MSRAGGRVGRQRLEVLRSELSGRDMAIVGQVASLRLMGARQIEAVHFPSEQHATALTAARTCRRTLERLVRDRLLVRLARRVGGIRAGSAGYVYALGPVGDRLVGSGSQRHRFREPSVTFMDHTLAISQIVVDLTVEARRGASEILRLQCEPACWRTFGGLPPQMLKPDLFVSLGVEDLELRWFIEVDRGTEHLPTLLRKCRSYAAYYRAGVEQAEHGVFPRVLWIMPTDARAKLLRSAVDADPSFAADLFVVTTFDHYQSVLMTGGGE